MKSAASQLKKSKARGGTGREKTGSNNSVATACGRCFMSYGEAVCVMRWGKSLLMEVVVCDGGAGPSQIRAPAGEAVMSTTAFYRWPLSVGRVRPSLLKCYFWVIGVRVAIACSVVYWPISYWLHLTLFFYEYTCNRTTAITATTVSCSSIFIWPMFCIYHK